MTTQRKLLITALLTIVTGCATQSQLTEAELSNRYPELNQLAADLQTADNQEVDLLSADLYQKAQQSYDEAIRWAQAGNDKARSFAAQGADFLTNAQASSGVAKDNLAGVLNARERAIKAGAEARSPVDFARAEKELRNLGDLISKGNLAAAREDRQQLEKRYANLEVETLKSTTAADADKVISEAIRQNADDLAPITFKRAQEELRLSKQVLETDANAQEKAAGHARNAFELANRSIYITEIIKEYKQSDMTDEQIVLWYQDQLVKSVNPAISSIDFTQSNKNVIADISRDLAEMDNELTMRQKRIDGLNAELASLRESHASELASKEAEINQVLASSTAERNSQAEFEARFRSIQEMFSSSEAEVYRQGDNVLVRSYGFSFLPGKSEIQSENFPLLYKIKRAIDQFPDSTVEVSGHTDNRGSDELNMGLSKERAQKVASFLVEVGNIDNSRVTSNGFGKEKPIASNETPEGRAANRRVEILIKNG